MSTDDPFRTARALFTLFQQGEIWLPNGKPPIQITDMDPAWRFNTARFLTRNARHYVLTYELGEHRAIWHAKAREVTGQMLSLAPSEAAAAGVERELEAASASRAEDPEAWIKSTPLYQALMKDLPDNAGELAKHWSDCAIREDGGTCTCWERHVTECPKRSDINEMCRCRDCAPEWTR
ncbi:hypothetical protein [Actinomadura sp. GTD37]|uniref:hypothetical protein n=1 Tax=Actinomadura sp. GTD37 TaxID=1778030 RepID=UPI0035C1BC13